MFSSIHVAPVRTTSNDDEDDLEEALRISQQGYDDVQHGRDPNVDTEGVTVVLFTLLICVLAFWESVVSSTKILNDDRWPTEEVGHASPSSRDLQERVELI